MAVSRQAMQSLFLKDADRQRQLKEEAKKRQHEALTITDRLATGGIGAITGAIGGFVQGGPAGAAVGAVTGGAKGLTSGKKGFEPALESAVSGYTGAMGAEGKGLEALKDPEKAASITESALGDPKKELQRLGGKAEKKKALEKETALEEKKAEREQRFKKELQKIKSDSDIDLQNLRGKQKKELEQIRLSQRKADAKKQLELLQAKEQRAQYAANKTEEVKKTRSYLENNYIKLNRLDPEFERASDILIAGIDKKIDEIDSDDMLDTKTKTTLKDQYRSLKTSVIKTRQLEGY